MHGYILRCADGTFYAGSAKYLDDRVAAHQQGLGSAYTTSRRPVELIWWLELDCIDEAFALEKQIQGLSHVRRLAFVEGGFDAIKGGLLESEPCERRCQARMTVSRETCGDRGHVEEVAST
ncbi:GIY-YIG nuclease family protein [Microbacterium sp. nov. GSS16]|uniref:GIY-YIG nuclease family protein n=1 Tax=Microbacterium sp. nov. GSS16 TaxID=3019890 RepID=UPI002306427F|nr:GIY-YIG nuclease family protein [Microbacterium sp. nov. GSS16]WCD93444.1 GIY-YIG nuclease family protein [Microbacterium sp. nov. GSS16]